MVASRGTATYSAARQILTQATGLDTEAEGTEPGESIIDDRDVAQELKKAALIWTIYRFPVRNIPTEAEDALLKQMPSWGRQSSEGKKNIRRALFNVYNEEQKCWKMHTIQNAGAVDIRASSGTA